MIPTPTLRLIRCVQGRFKGLVYTDSNVPTARRPKLKLASASHALALQTSLKYNASSSFASADGDATPDLTRLGLEPDSGRHQCACRSQIHYTVYKLARLIGQATGLKMDS